MRRRTCNVATLDAVTHFTMTPADPAPLREGIDFYREGSYMVFTAEYLSNRGYCCESACRHCPWGYRRDLRSDVPVEGDEPTT